MLILQNMSVMLSRGTSPVRQWCLSVTLPLKTMFPSQEYSLPSKSRNFSNGRQFICLAVTCFLHAFCCDANRVCILPASCLIAARKIYGLFKLPCRVKEQRHHFLLASK